MFDWTMTEMNWPSRQLTEIDLLAGLLAEMN